MFFLQKIRRIIAKTNSNFQEGKNRYIQQEPVPSSWLDPAVPAPSIINHENKCDKAKELGNKKGYKVLEIGSRTVTSSNALFKNVCTDCEYVGFDYHSGNNVDVVGDVHKLTSYFPSNEKFDLIVSSACFEHFAMPWVAAEEIVKMLKIGGHLIIETHFSYSSHERPWHFFQFSDMALRVLFSKHLGIECLDAGMCNPMLGEFSPLASKYLQGKKITGLYCHSIFLGKKIEDVSCFNWKDIDINELLSGTVYPKHSEK